MSEEYMLCNFKNCYTPLTKTAWITRCSHVFCDKHGIKYFCNHEARIKCPACNEIRNRESDIFKIDLNPSDMLISCVRPDKVLDYASRAAKLWCYQMQIKRKLNMGSVCSKYEKMASEAVLKYKHENNGQ
ncbi:hypothetical protein AAG570_006412 [Ranatra chinensis]|uniref:RING-type domain-containing protein n=1 Tax=Ranatra chinensis TaxID=642074 RepID=A0ABD0YTX7_9HEMI